MSNIKTTFYGKDKPDVFSVGDLWFSEKLFHKPILYVAEEQNGEIVWVEKR